jgi:glutathione S-transferase
MSALPILYSFRRCPYAMRARLGILEAELKVELREVVLRDKPNEMIEASPKATVPVLILPDGRVIDESRDIIDWALEENTTTGLLDKDPLHQRALIDTLDADFKPHLDRYKYPNRYSGEPPADHQAIALDWMNTHLAPRLTTHENLFGDKVSFADLASFPFIRQYAHVDRDWFYSAVPQAVGDWLQRHIESDRFAAIMSKYKQWASGEPGIVFPHR